MKSDRLILARESRGMSRADLAAATGIGLASLGFYERGERDPGSENVEKICRCLNVSADYLLGLSDSELPQHTPATLDPDRMQRAAYLSELVYQLAEKDQAAAYDRDCLPIYQEMLEALLELIQSTDEAFDEIRAKYPVFTGTTPGSIPDELRLAYIAQNMNGAASKASDDWLTAYNEFTNKTNTHVSSTGNRIHFLISLDMLGRLVANRGRDVKPGPTE